MTIESCMMDNQNNLVTVFSVFAHMDLLILTTEQCTKLLKTLNRMRTWRQHVLNWQLSQTCNFKMRYSPYQLINKLQKAGEKEQPMRPRNKPEINEVNEDDSLIRMKQYVCVTVN